MIGAKQEESHIAITSDRTSFEEWMKLQQSLIEEQYEMRYEEELKNKLLDELILESKNYYQTYINVLVQSNMNQEQKILEESTYKLFRSAETKIKFIFQKLSNSKVCSAIFQHHNNTNRTIEIESLIRTFINSIYDNIACGSMWKQPILKLMSEIITTEVNQQEFPEFLWDREDTLTQFILKEFAKRPENVKYTKEIFKNSLIQITKVDKFLDLDKRKIAGKLREEKQRNEKQSLSSSAFNSKQVPITQNSSHKSMPQRQIPIILPIRNVVRFLTMERRSIALTQESQSESPIRKLSKVYSLSDRPDQFMNDEINSVLIVQINSKSWQTISWKAFLRISTQYLKVFASFVK